MYVCNSSKNSIHEADEPQKNVIDYLMTVIYSDLLIRVGSMQSLDYLLGFEWILSSK